MDRRAHISAVLVVAARRMYLHNPVTGRNHAGGRPIIVIIDGDNVASKLYKVPSVSQEPY